MTSGTLQDVRRILEGCVFNAAGSTRPRLEVFTDNQFYDEVSLNDEFVLARLTFGPMQVVGLMASMEAITGTFVVEFYTKKGRGPARCQEVAALVMSRLTELNNTFHPPDPATGARVRIGAFSGPSFFMADNRQHFACRVSCGFRATVPSAPNGVSSDDCRSNS